MPLLLASCGGGGGGQTVTMHVKVQGTTASFSIPVGTITLTVQ